MTQSPSPRSASLHFRDRLTSHPPVLLSASGKKEAFFPSMKEAKSYTSILRLRKLHVAQLSVSRRTLPLKNNIKCCLRLRNYLTFENTKC